MKDRTLVKEPTILVFTEKHGNMMYIVHNEEELHKACCNVIKERIKDGYWYGLPDIPDNITGFKTKDEIEALPDGTIKNQALREWDSYERSIRYYNEAVDFEKALKKAIEYDFNPKDSYWVRGQAYHALNDRSDCEYEGIELRTPSKV